MNTDKKVNVAILGASGYTGSELIRILSHHPKVNIVALTAEKNFGKSISNLFPSLSNLKLPDLKKINEINFNEKGSSNTIDLVFSALPSGQLQEIISSIPQIIIDLSADFRLQNLDLFEEVYGFKHKCPSKQTDAVYGLTELFRETGTAPEIGIGGPASINSMSDVFRLAGITGEDGISMGTDYSGTTLPSGGDANTLPRGINMRNTLQENLAANEAQRAANQRVLEAARARLPGAGIMNASSISNEEVGRPVFCTSVCSIVLAAIINVSPIYQI